MAENKTIKGKITSLYTYHTDAYAVAVRNGFEGTEAEWLESLRARSTEEAIAAAKRAEEAEKNAKANIKAAENEAVAHLASLAEGAYDIVQTPGDSETQVMSQKAVTKNIVAKADTPAVLNLSGVVSIDGYYASYHGFDYIEKSKRTDYICVSGYETVYVETMLSEYGYAVAFFNANKEFVEDGSVLGNNSTQKLTIEIPTDAYYMIVSSYNYDTANYKLYSKNSLESVVEEELSNLRDQVDFATTGKADAPAVLNLSGVVSIDGYYASYHGFDYIEKSKRTDYICVSGYETVYVETMLSEYGYAVAFFNANKEFVEDGSVLGNNSTQKLTIEIPTDAYYMIVSSYNYDTANYKVYSEGTLASIVEKEVYSVCSNGFSAFAKWGVIGDSLSVGHTADTAGNQYPRNIYYSWGQCLARRLGNICLNFGVSGMTAETWMSNSKCYNRVIEADNLCQAYIIALGANDAGELTSSYANGLGSIGDIDFTNMENNADSFYGWYAKVINTVSTVAPLAKIFLFTVPYPRNQSEDVKLINSAIVEMARNENFSNIHLVDISSDYDNYYRANGVADMLVSGHYTAVGYANVSFINEMALSNAMNKDKAEYQDIPFIPFGSTTELD